MGGFLVCLFLGAGFLWLGFLATGRGLICFGLGFLIGLTVRDVGS